MDAMGMLLLFQAIAGVYLLYVGFANRGKAYENEHIKKGREEEYHKLVRVFCFIGGGIALADALLGYLKLDIAANIGLGVLFLYVVYVSVRIMRMTERRK